jgi:hypothetical protein
MAAALAHTQRVDRAGGYTHSAAITDVRIDLRPALVFGADGLVVATVEAGHTDHLIPGNAGTAVELYRTDHGSVAGGSFNVHGTNLDTGLAKGTASVAEIEEGNAGQFMRCRVYLDDARFARLDTGLCAVQAMLGKRLPSMPGRGRAQWLLPPGLFPATGAGQ